VSPEGKRGSGRPSRRVLVSCECPRHRFLLRLRQRPPSVAINPALVEAAASSRSAAESDSSPLLPGLFHLGSHYCRNCPDPADPGKRENLEIQAPRSRTNRNKCFTAGTGSFMLCEFHLPNRLARPPLLAGAWVLFRILPIIA
jgi:hypothetical protein